MMEVHTDSQGESLLPSGPGGLFAAIFCDPSDRANDGLLARFAEKQWPEPVRPVVVDIRGAQDTARWFGMDEGPVLTLISDGTLLAVEYNLSEGACCRLMDCGLDSLTLLRTS